MSQRVTVSTRVAAEPAEAFALFTGEIGAWWAAGAVRGARWNGVLRFEPGVGGRLLKAIGDQLFEIGRVQRWEPPARFVFECREAGEPDGPCTEIEVRFAPAEGGTRVTLEHRGWDRVPLEHASRHGYGASDAFTSMIGLWWGDLLTSLRAHAGKGAPR